MLGLERRSRVCRSTAGTGTGCESAGVPVAGVHKDAWNTGLRSVVSSVKLAPTINPPAFTPIAWLKERVRRAAPLPMLKRSLNGCGGPSIHEKPCIIGRRLEDKLQVALCPMTSPPGFNVVGLLVGELGQRGGTGMPGSALPIVHRNACELSWRLMTT